MGCWPIAGVTTLGANEADSLATLHAAIDAGVTHFDNAYVYGPNGESERLLGRAVQGRRDRLAIATKGGVHFEGDAMAQDARPETLRRQCDESLLRMGVDHVDLLYLHSPDPGVPIEDSAGALRELQRSGKTIAVGASNCVLEQIERFHRVCPLGAVQLPYNLLQRGIERRTLPWCRERGIAVMSYWPLMKGVLADRLPRDGALPTGDKRLRYPVYRGEEWAKTQRLLADLRTIAQQAGRTVAQVVVNWTLQQPGITSVLCGAKRAWQIEETAAAMGWRLTGEQLAAVEAAATRRGPAPPSRDFA